MIPMDILPRMPEIVNDRYALYLRKSRADLDAEARGEGETLSKHRAALTEYAKRRGLLIVREYAEIVSGDSIAAHPQMQQLLNDVKAGMYAGVIVNDVDRLGRGDSIDQEIIKYTFAAAHCLIITPSRDIDPASPSDQDMLDFSMFLARFEYRKISQRMSEGRVRSAARGNAVSAIPYGYRRLKTRDRVTLEPDPNEAPNVKLFFQLYASGRYSLRSLTGYIEDIGIRNRDGKPFTFTFFRHALTNPVYIGTIVFGKQHIVKAIENGQRVKHTVNSSAPPLVIQDAHEPIIDHETFDAVQRIHTESKWRFAPVKKEQHIKNPFAGLIQCAYCGHILCKRENRHGEKRFTSLVCNTHNCPCSSTPLHAVEDAVISTLRHWCIDYTTPTANAPRADIEPLKQRLAQLDAQMQRIQELVETGVYSPAEYIQRRDAINAQRTTVNAQIDSMTQQPVSDAIVLSLPTVRTVLDTYYLAETPEQKNALLKSVISKIIYKRQHGETLTLDVYPVVSS